MKALLFAVAISLHSSKRQNNFANGVVGLYRTTSPALFSSIKPEFGLQYGSDDTNNSMMVMLIVHSAAPVAGLLW